MAASAVKSMEQTRQCQRTERHGASDRGAALVQSQMEGCHGTDSDQAALEDQLHHEFLCQYSLFRISRFLRQQILFRRLHTDCDGRKRVRQKVDKQQMYRCKRNGKRHDGRVQYRQDPRHIS